MKSLSIVFLSIFLWISIPLSGQGRRLSGKILKQLDLVEKEMINAISNGDSTSFKEIAGAEYLDINAQGIRMTLQPMLNNLHNFKGVTIHFSEQCQRIYENFVLKNGRAKFYSGDQLLGDVFYTQGWVYRDKKWQFVHWQGTMTNDFDRKK